MLVFIQPLSHSQLIVDLGLTLSHDFRSGLSFPGRLVVGSNLLENRNANEEGQHDDDHYSLGVHLLRLDKVFVLILIILMLLFELNTRRCLQNQLLLLVIFFGILLRPFGYPLGGLQILHYLAFSGRGEYFRRVLDLID